MKIDAHIFALVQTLAAFLQFTALFDQYWGSKNRKGIGWWMMGNASLTLGYLCNYLRDMSSFGLLLIFISNVLFVLGMELIYVGVMRFFDRKERRGWLIAFCIIISLIAAYFTYINNDLGFRRINISIAVATMSFFIARALFLYKIDSVRSSAYFLICVFIVNGCFFSVRAFTPFLGTIGEMFTLSLMQISTYLTTLLTTSLWTIGFIFMANHNLNTEQSNKNQRPAIKDHVMAVVIYLLLALITQSLFKTITVWPSAGLVLAAFMVLGVHIWPSIAIGTFLGVIAYFIEIDQPPFCAANLVINLTTVIGNTSAGVVAFRVCGRVDSLVNSFGKYKWIINRFLVSVFIFGIVSAIPGVGAYWLIGHPWETGYLQGVSNWTISNIVGAIVITPIFVSLRLERIVLRPLKFDIFITFGLLLLTFMIFGYGESIIPPIFHQPSFLLIPLVFVAVKRSQGFTFFLLALTFFLVWSGTTMGYGPFFELHESVANASMQVFIGVSAIVILLMQSLLVEQRKIRESWAEELFEINTQLEQKVEERTHELREANKKLSETNLKLAAISITDGLTQIANRRHFDEIMSQEYTRHIRSRANLSLILLDIDHFKAFNDNYGHVNGDECLRQVARVIADCAARPADLAARYGGEEFACILPETDSNGAVAVAENIRIGVMALKIPHKASKVAEYVTVSLGVITVQCSENISAVEIVAKVDDELYRAKSSGRNKVEFTVIINELLPSVGEIHGRLVNLVWQETFYSGNTIIDSQHKVLFQNFNELLEKALSVRPFSKNLTPTETPIRTDILEMITRLIDDIKQHFHDEKSILEAAGFPELKQHTAEHARLMAKSLELSQDFKNSTLSVGDIFQFFAYEVITLHMFSADQAFFPFLSNTRGKT